MLTFNSFVEYGKLCTNNIVDGNPMTFMIKDIPVSRESDTAYIVGCNKFTINDVIVIKNDSVLTIVNKDEFIATWEEK